MIFYETDRYYCFYQKIAVKAYQSFKSGVEQFDYPSYGGNLSKKEIACLSPEHVDAIQDIWQDANKNLTENQFVERVFEQYRKIMPAPTKKMKI